MPVACRNAAATVPARVPTKHAPTKHASPNTIATTVFASNTPKPTPSQTAPEQPAIPRHSARLSPTTGWRPDLSTPDPNLTTSPLVSPTNRPVPAPGAGYGGYDSLGDADAIDLIGLMNSPSF